jgi:hypothetical protein
VIEYVIRRKAPHEDVRDISRKTYGEMVGRIVCLNCHHTVCIAQCDGWPPHGPVTLHIGSDWEVPTIDGEFVMCGDCGGATMPAREA